MSDFLGTLYAWISFVPKITKTNVLEIVILAFVIYEIMVWIKNTRAWTLLKGIVVILVFAVMAWILKLYTILWILEKTALIATTAIVIIFQPELRKALEQLGSKNLISGIFSFEGSRPSDSAFTEKTISELVKACFDMGEVKTGALIVIEQNELLTDYIRTGINLDAILTSQLLINIFEHNTPLHDGAVIVRENRIVAATCYLPLSDNMELSKQLGTRHRAGVGISEQTDSVTIIVSEETGQVSVAQGGKLTRGVNSAKLREILVRAQNKQVVDNSKLRHLLKGRVKHEEAKNNR